MPIRRSLFVTTALPYANGSFHIGHIMEYIQADIWVRFQRMQGHEVHFVCADDAHGAPIMLKAEAEGVTPQELVARIAAERPRYLEGFHISFDHWHSTDSPENTELSQDIYRKLKAAGLIATRPVEQFYDPVKAMFLADRYIKGECPKCGARDQYGDACEVCSSVYAPTELKNPYSTLSGAAPVLRSSEHHFFRLSDPKCREFLQGWIDAPGRLQPQVANKAREWLEGEGDQALGDWDISRDAPYFGIPIPDAPGKYFYVWLDAPIGYLASLKSYCARRGVDFEAFLAAPRTEQVHFIGKDIIYFHTLFWPAMLKFAGKPYRVPDHVYVHGFITVSGEKMSKSRGTGISPLRYLELGMNPEWLRYYIAAKLNANVEDLDFNPDDFVARVNSDLVGKYVNIASRCAVFVARKFGGQLELPERVSDYSAELFGAPDKHVLGDFQAVAGDIAELYEQREYSKALREVMRLADLANQFVDEQKPWELSKQAGSEEKLQHVCSIGINLFRLLTLYLKPVVPRIAAQAERFLDIPPLQWADSGSVLSGGHRINPYNHLLARVEERQLDALFEPPAAVEPSPQRHAEHQQHVAQKGTPVSEHISIDDFGKIDLRVAKIVDAERVEGADKLVKLTLDIGTETRTVFAGIKAAYTPESLKGRFTVMVANLAPRKMRFGVSEGMVLAASREAVDRPGAGEEIFLVAPDSGALPGMRVK
jgi:methionyl-tRNA synthetase